ncbi:MAG: hypothetical protein ACW986_08245 [Promethearchaeota archaeon]|jgi:hypothetical protein
MNVKLNIGKGKRARGMTPNFTLTAPPHDKYSAFQPGAYSSMYHRCEAEKMKRSYNWLLSEFEEVDQNIKKKSPSKTIENLPPIKTSIEEGVLKVQVGEYRENLLNEVLKINPIIEEGLLKVELGENDKKKVILIDVRGYAEVAK